MRLNLVYQWYSTAMTRITQPHVAPDIRRVLGIYLLGLLSVMVITHAAIAIAGGAIGPAALIMLAAVAVGLAVWWSFNGRRLGRVRFGPVVAHTIAFVTIAGSFMLHASIRVFVLAQAPQGYDAAADMILRTPWFGLTFGMTSLWAVGLAMHLAGAVLTRGWED